MTNSELFSPGHLNRIFAFGHSLRRAFAAIAERDAFYTSLAQYRRINYPLGKSCRGFKKWSKINLSHSFPSYLMTTIKELNIVRREWSRRNQ